MGKLKLISGQYQFIPNFWSGLITVLLLPLFVYLGFWQLQRMETKQSLEKNREQQLLKTPLTAQELFRIPEGNEIIENPLTHRYRSLSIQGELLLDKNILLDNQILKGQPGYRVFTPLKSASSDILLLVDRGFIPWGGDRNHLPSIQKSPIKVSLDGFLQQLSQGPVLKKEILNNHLWPIRIQQLNLETISMLLQRDEPSTESQLERQRVYPLVLQLPENSPYAFQNLPVSMGLSPHRHLGYAVQWFTMAFAILIYYVVINIKRRKT